MPVIWKLGVFIGNNSTQNTNTIIKWRIGRNPSAQTVTGTTPNNMQDPDTIVLDELQTAADAGAGDRNLGPIGTGHLWYEYFMPQGLLIPRGSLFFMVNNQAGEAGSSLSFETGMQVQYTMLPLRSGEILQSVVGGAR